jgi:hypothetical protein
MTLKSPAHENPGMTEKNCPRDLAAWLDYLEALHPRGQAGIELGLERARQVSIALVALAHVPVWAQDGWTPPRDHRLGSRLSRARTGFLPGAGFTMTCYNTQFCAVLMFQRSRHFSRA